VSRPSRSFCLECLRSTVPNGIGAALGVVQIFLVLTFPRIPALEEVEEVTEGPTEMLNAQKPTNKMRQYPEKGMPARGGTDSDTEPIRGDILVLSKDRSEEDHSI
jgi:hypothetical protein